MKTRIWIDFSTAEKVNENWESLVRCLYGRPLHSKPRVGSPPKYLKEDSGESSEAMRSRLAALESAVLSGGRKVNLHRSDFIDECFQFADELRIRVEPDEQRLGEKVIDDCRKLMAVRNSLVDWVKLEAGVCSAEELTPILIEVLERMLELKARPPELNAWNDEWIGAHSVFVYESFLYLLAALIRSRAFDVLREVFAAHYMLPEAVGWAEEGFGRFERFHGHSRALSDALRVETGRKFVSPAAELIKRQATRSDLTFKSIIEAELLVFLMTFLEGGLWWFPGTVFYAQHSWKAPLFEKATRHRDFVKLSRVLGVEDADFLRQSVPDLLREKLKDFDTGIGFGNRPNFLRMMNLERLDTLP